MSKKLFIGNLPFDVNDADLVTILSVVGEVASAKVIINRKSGRSKGYAFAEMATEALAQEAIQKFEGATLNERPLTVQLATPKQEADAKSEASGESAAAPKIEAKNTAAEASAESAAPENTSGTNTATPSEEATPS